jgi:hypothetical protein
MCEQVDSHPGGLKQLAGKYGVFDHITITILEKSKPSPTKALLESKRGWAKHTIEELAGFLEDLGMETTARKAMVEKLRTIDASDSSHLAPLCACGERLSRIEGTTHPCCAFSSVRSSPFLEFYLICAFWACCVLLPYFCIIIFYDIRFDGLLKFNHLHQHSRSSAIEWVRFFKLDLFHFAANCISVVCEHNVTSEHHKANAAGERAGQGLDCARCRVRHRASNRQTQRNATDRRDQEDCAHALIGLLCKRGVSVVSLRTNLEKINHNDDLANGF